MCSSYYIWEGKLLSVLQEATLDEMVAWIGTMNDKNKRNTWEWLRREATHGLFKFLKADPVTVLVAVPLTGTDNQIAAYPLHTLLTDSEDGAGCRDAFVQTCRLVQSLHNYEN